MMRSSAVAAPGMLWGLYPERRPEDRGQFAQRLALLRSVIGQPALRADHGQRAFIARVHTAGAALTWLSCAELQAKAAPLRAQLARDGLTDALVSESFALIKEIALRELGVSLYDTQIIAARAMLTNHLVEMQTGEGKTLAGLLTVATAAMSGIPVHVITANEYLAARDADMLRPAYHALGLSVGCVQQKLAPAQRQAMYACDVTYCTAKELVFDYLRDRQSEGQRRGDLQRRVSDLNGQATTKTPLLLRGLCMALIDEADSVLLDEARVPLILSRSKANTDQDKYHRDALALARRLSAGVDFELDRSSSTAQLTVRGQARLTAMAAELGALWRNRRQSEEVVCLALAAVHLFERDKYYLLRDGKVRIIDATTGRIADGRVWSRGLQQLIEIKEGCKVSGEQHSVAQITYQRFFPRYLRLAGMSGTLTEARGELRAVYGLRVAKIALRTPSRRESLGVKIYPTAAAQWDAVLARVREVHRTGRPILIGTDSVADSEALSARLGAAQLPHAVLNARQDQNEAEIVAQAGAVASITVATNMAGRGTDIPLVDAVRARGGLHVISCQHNSAQRIDRQMHGRCARQGDPGSVETIGSLEGALLSQHVPAWARRLVARMAVRDGALSGWLSAVLLRYPQVIAEHKQWFERWQLRKQDAVIARRLSFGGASE
jgi:preprotein translocase subunit SecA